MALGWRTQYTRYKKYFLNVAIFYKKRQDIKMFLEILLTLGTVLIFAVGALRPTLLTIANLLTDINEKEKVLEKMESKLQSLASAQTLWGRERERLAPLDTAIPDEPDPAKYVRQIEGVAQRNGVEISRMTSDGVTLVGRVRGSSNVSSDEKLAPLPAGTGQFSLSLNVSVGYDPLLGFLGDLENLRRPYVFDELAIRTVSEEENLTLSVEGRVPYALEE